MTTRRDFLALTAGAFAVAGLPGAVFAAAPGDRRLVLVLLRGALDGLAAVPPIGDRRYAERRGAIALTAEDCIALDHGFALNAGLKDLEPYYRKGQLLIVPASGNGYHTRSHFDAQDLMECGLSAKARETGGWLNRALALVQKGNSRSGLAVGGAVPLVLRGAGRDLGAGEFPCRGFRFHSSAEDNLCARSALRTGAQDGSAVEEFFRDGSRR
jgi:uncharacterized protein (DUF1501 family)